MPYRPVERRSVTSAVFEQLAAEILAGRACAGSTLPGERSLTASFGVNRQAVREALQRLDQMGLVEIQHGGATRVRDFRRSGGLELLTHLAVRDDGSIDLAVIRSVMEMRAAIGPDAARLCARRGVPSLIERLVATLEEMASAAPDVPLLAALDLHFWDLVVDGSDNLAYRFSLNALRAVYEPIEHVVHEVLADELLDVDGHAATANAIAAGDEAAAESAARALLARGTAAMSHALALLDPAGGGAP